MISNSAQRVRIHTPDAVNDSIRRRTAASVAYYAMNPQHIDARLRELDEEWDVERMLETVSAAFSLVGLVGVVTGKRRWVVLPMVVQGFFLQHAVQGWCPPLPVLRRLGVRTTAEIDEERYALKALRGDFADVSGEDAQHKADMAYRAAVRGNGWHGDRRRGTDVDELDPE